MRHYLFIAITTILFSGKNYATALVEHPPIDQLGPSAQKMPTHYLAGAADGLEEQIDSQNYFSPEENLVLDQLLHHVDNFLDFQEDASAQLKQALDDYLHGKPNELFDSWMVARTKQERIQQTLSVLRCLEGNIEATRNYFQYINAVEIGDFNFDELLRVFMNLYLEKSRLRATDMVAGHAYPPTLPEKMDRLDDAGKWMAVQSIDTHEHQFLLIETLYAYLAETNQLSAESLETLTNAPVLLGQLTGRYSTAVSPDASIIDGLFHEERRLGNRTFSGSDLSFSALKKKYRNVYHNLQLIQKRQATTTGINVYKTNDFIPEEVSAAKSTPEPKAQKKPTKKKGKQKKKQKHKSKKQGHKQPSAKQPGNKQSESKKAEKENIVNPTTENTPAPATILAETTIEPVSERDVLKVNTTANILPVEAVDLGGKAEQEDTTSPKSLDADASATTEISTDTDSSAELSSDATSESDEAPRIPASKSFINHLDTLWDGHELSYADFVTAFEGIGGIIIDGNGSHKRIRILDKEGKLHKGGTYKPHGRHSSLRNGPLKSIREFLERSMLIPEMYYQEG